METFRIGADSDLYRATVGLMKLNESGESDLEQQPPVPIPCEMRAFLDGWVGGLRNVRFPADRWSVIVASSRLIVVLVFTDGSRL